MVDDHVIGSEDVLLTTPPQFEGGPQDLANLESVDIHDRVTLLLSDLVWYEILPWAEVGVRLHPLLTPVGLWVKIVLEGLLIVKGGETELKHEFEDAELVLVAVALLSLISIYV